jgi:hypothetical protein
MPAGIAGFGRGVGAQRQCCRGALLVGKDRRGHRSAGVHCGFVLHLGQANENAAAALGGVVDAVCATIRIGGITAEEQAAGCGDGCRGGVACARRPGPRGSCGGGGYSNGLVVRGTIG